MTLYDILGAINDAVFVRHQWLALVLMAALILLGGLVEGTAPALPY